MQKRLRIVAPRRWHTANGRRRRADAGVTLIEMMVVLAIIAVVAVMIVPNLIGRPDQARVTVTRTDMRTIAAAVEMYRLDNRAYPTTSQGLRALVEKPVESPVPPAWHEGGYLPELPRDAWGNEFLYRNPGTTGQFDLASMGADGVPGGDGVNADLVHGADTR